MRIHALYHVPFEEIGHIRQWISDRGPELTETALYAPDMTLPPADDLDLLIVMGGPMGIYDEQDHPWLKAEKAFIAEVIGAGKKVLGICLGAQLIADVLGARVAPNPQKEIGWYPVHKTPAAAKSAFAHILPDTFTPLHWHGDRFEIPTGAVHLFTSEACDHQAFSYEDRVLGLQFHLETTPESLAALIDHCGHELQTPAPYIQTVTEMTRKDAPYAPCHVLIHSLLDRLVAGR